MLPDQNPDCTTSAYGGCDCPKGKCRIDQRRKDDEAELRSIIAQRNADTVLAMFVAVLSVAAFLASFIFIAIPESQRLARANQENIYVQR